MDLLKENSLLEEIDLVRKLYERFNTTYGNIIDMNRVNAAISSIQIVNSDKSNLPSIIKERLTSGADGIYWDGKIYIQNNISADLLFHEILHYITYEHRGVQIPLVSSYSEQQLGEKIVKYGENRFMRQIEQLDESMTRFITELAIPEAEISDSYAYGASVIRKYYNAVLAKEMDPSFMINMYINGNQEDMDKFITSFGEDFDDLLNTIERANNIRLYILKKPNDSIKTSEQIENMVNNAVEKLIVTQHK